MDEQALEVVNRYYKHLAQFGYFSQRDVNRALLYLTLLQWVEEYKEYLTKCDLELISAKLNCLEGSSCLIPADRETSVSDLLSVVFGTRLRTSENNIIRKTQEGCYRLPLMK